jgi:hypothetical protein
LGFAFAFVGFGLRRIGRGGFIFTFGIIYPFFAGCFFGVALPTSGPNTSRWSWS